MTSDADTTCEVDDQIRTMLEEARALLRLHPCAEMHHGLLDSPGKLLRPRLLLLCAAHGQATGGRPCWASARRAAIAIQLGHAGSLHHDDIVDRSRMRRGAAAAHVQFGVRDASLAGAHLLALANLLIADLPAELRAHWGRTALQMVDGQLRDFEAAGSASIPVDDYLETAFGKTGAAFEMAAYFGAVLGGSRPTDRRYLVEFGRCIGLAFQLHNDLEDFSADAAIHRPRANDLRERVYSLPILLASRQPGTSGDRLRKLLEEDGRPITSTAIDEIYELLLAGGHVDAARAYVDRQYQRALDLASELSPSPVVLDMRKLASVLVGHAPSPWRTFG